MGIRDPLLWSQEQSPWEQNLFTNQDAAWNKPFTAQQAMGAVNTPQFQQTLAQLPQALPQAQQQQAPQERALPQGGWGGQLNTFLGSPGFALASGALQNLGNSAPNSRGRQVDPVAAMQEAQRKNEVLQMRRAQMIDNQRQTAQMRQIRDAQESRRSNPAFEYEYLRDKGMLPEGMTYENFIMSPMNRTGASSKAFAPKIGTVDGKKVMLTPTYDPSNGQVRLVEQNLPEGWTEDSGIQEVNTGDKIDMYRKSDGAFIGSKPIALAPNETVEYKEDVAGAAKKGATLEEQAAGVRSTSQGMPLMDAQIARNNEIISAIDESGAYSGTGPVSGYVNRLFDPEVAALEAEGIYNGLMNLQITKLTPITENEIKMISKLWASAFRGGKVNKALLQEANRRIESMKSQAQQAIDYYNKDDVVLPDGRVKGYGSMEGYQMGSSEQSPDGSVRAK
jgi:hypothetical protein